MFAKSVVYVLELNAKAIKKTPIHFKPAAYGIFSAT